MDCFTSKEKGDEIPIRLVEEKRYLETLNGLNRAEQNWIKTSTFKGEPGTHCIVPGADGGIAFVLVIANATEVIWSLAKVVVDLPTSTYKLETDMTPERVQQILIGWGLANYSFDFYKKAKKSAPVLLWPNNIDQADIEAQISATSTVRDLVNQPPNEMMPQHLARSSEQLAERYGCTYSEVRGQALLDTNYPMIHAVGRASVHEPRLLKLEWGDPDDPLLCLVGKGVCFDSGGLDIKPASGMRQMKKDMGGAAHVLGLAAYIMQCKLAVHLCVWIPAVENAISGDAFRPGDILSSRAGKTVEIDNTDAEGRLVLADAITEACKKEPDLLVDFATLTGAARVALGTEVGVFFTNQEQLGQALREKSDQVDDPIWPLPLHDGYRSMLDSDVADLVNSASTGLGGAITAALFLQTFLEPRCPWVHFDIMAFNTRARPGRPKGGEAMGLRSMMAFVRERYSQ